MDCDDSGMVGDRNEVTRRRIVQQLAAAARVPEAAIPEAVRALELELAVLVARARGATAQA